MSGNVPTSYYSQSESRSQWYQLAEAVGSQMSQSHSTPYSLVEDLLKTYNAMEKTEKTVPEFKGMGEGHTSGGGGGRGR